MELPLEELKLVHALQIAPRASWVQLGRALERHPTTLAAHWERLRAGGLAWITGHPGIQGCVTFISLEYQPGQRAELLHRLCAAPEIDTVEESARTWGLRLTVLTRDWQQLINHVMPMVRADPAIRRTQLTVATRVYTIGNSWRLDVLSPDQQRRTAALNAAAAHQAGVTAPHLEEMMHVLRRDGRASTTEIAAATGTHRATAGRHLQQAIGTGLLALRCELAQQHSGYPLTCQWYARVPQAQTEAAVRYLRSYRTLRLCASITGDTNLMFFMWLRTPGDIMDVEGGLQAAAPGVQVVESDVGVRTHKRMGWLLREDSTATGEVVV